MLASDVVPASGPEEPESAPVGEPSLAESEEAAMRSQWICPNAPLFWSQRVAANRTCPDWHAVARAFALDMPPTPDPGHRL